jgi:hypothetical protein
MKRDAILWHVASRGDRFPVLQIKLRVPRVSIGDLSGAAESDHKQFSQAMERF